MKKPKIFLTGSDYKNWALDEGVRLTRDALGDMVEFSSLAECDVVHSMWWEKLLELPEGLLSGKRVICHFSNRPFHYLTLPRFLLARNLVGSWIAQTRQAQRELESVRIPCDFIPYTVDTDIFRPLESDDPALHNLRKQWKIPRGPYLVGNFHRDTEGHDLRTPKAQKGPDLFAEIVHYLISKGHQVHVILAGPRRFWLRSRLEELRVPFTYVGEMLKNTDDIGVNILPRNVLNLLYNMIDLYLVTSRWEGGPRSVLEASAARCKILSTRVGLAEDVLESGAIYGSPDEAMAAIEKDIAGNHLEKTVLPQYRKVLRYHTPKAVRSRFHSLYKNMGKIPSFTGGIEKKSGRNFIKSLTDSFLTRVGIPRKRKTQTICLWRRFFDPPYGGGNQFMIALRKALIQRGFRILENHMGSHIDAHLINSVSFDVDRFRKCRKRNNLQVIHRIDGPIHLYRGSSPDLDYLCFDLNREFATGTVLQSAWTYQHIIEMGYEPVNPVIIHNAADPDIFYSHDRVDFDRNRRIRLVSTSWSDNPRKGGPIYKWIEDHLDWDRFEYTLVGNVSERLDRIRHIPPVPSEQLADILRSHDIYITASKNDPCSNALIEALSCGLPALYLNSGGHPELVGFGGLPFDDVDEILPQLNALVGNYDMFQRMIIVPSLHDVAEKYLTLFFKQPGDLALR